MKLRGNILAVASAATVIGAALASGNDLEKSDEQFARDAWRHFNARCENEAGEMIYETFPHVNSVVVLKPLPPASDQDFYDQFWHGDPYSNATPSRDRAEQVASTLLGTVRSTEGESRGFDFVEMPAAGGSDGAFVRLTAAKDAATRRTGSLASRFAVVWEDISTPEDRKHWVAASRLRIIDLLTESLVAERVGFLIEPGSGSGKGERRSWLTARGPGTTCPALVDGTYEDRSFVLSVLRPGER